MATPTDDPTRLGGTHPDHAKVVARWVRRTTLWVKVAAWVGGGVGTIALLDLGAYGAALLLAALVLLLQLPSVGLEGVIELLRVQVTQQHDREPADVPAD